MASRIFTIKVFLANRDVQYEIEFEVVK